MRLDTAVRQGGRHLHAEGRRLDDHRNLDGVQYLVPLQGELQAAHVVDAIKIEPGDAGFP